MRLRSEWTSEGDRYGSGSLLAMAFEDFVGGRGKSKLLYQPSSRQSVTAFFCTRSLVVFSVLDDLASQVWTVHPDEHRSTSQIQEFPPGSNAEIWADASSTPLSNEFLVIVSSFIEPPYLALVDDERRPKILRQGPASFDATDFEVSRPTATSVDSASIPYIQIAPRKCKGASRHSCAGMEVLEYRFLQLT